VLSTKSYNHIHKLSLTYKQTVKNKEYITVSKVSASVMQFLHLISERFHYVEVTQEKIGSRQDRLDGVYLGEVFVRDERR